MAGVIDRATVLREIRGNLERLQLSADEIEAVLENLQHRLTEGDERRRRAEEAEATADGRIVDAAEADCELKSQIQALLASEGSYIEKLDIIVKVFLIPLRSGVVEGVKMKTQAVIDIFSNIDILCSIHHEFHLRLQACVDKFPLLPIGELFLKTIHSLELYTQFVNNFSNSINTIEVEQKRSKTFAQFLLVKEEEYGMGLETLLSVPLNRIAQYRAICSTLFEMTARNNPDHKNMVQLMESLPLLQERINISLTQSHEMAQMINVEQRVQGRDNLSLRDPNRQFIHEGPVLMLDGDGKKVKDKDAYLFLFNDVILCTRKTQQKNVFKHKKLCQLQYATMTHDGCKILLHLVNDDTKLLGFQLESVAEKEEWAGHVDTSMKLLTSKLVYGVHLSQLMEREPPEQLIPSFVEALLKRLEEVADTPGIFRVSGSKNALNSVKDTVNAGKAVDVSILDDHVVSGLLKEFFRSMPEPVIPFNLYDDLLEAGSANDPIAHLRDLVSHLPAANAALLKRLMLCLAKVASMSEVNKMNTSNLAIVIGPNLARAAPFDEDNPMAEIGFSASGGPLVEMMIKHCDTIFPKDARTFAKAMPKSMVYSKASSTITVAAGPLLGGTRTGRGSRVGESDEKEAEEKEAKPEEPEVTETQVMMAPRSRACRTSQAQGMAALALAAVARSTSDSKLKKTVSPPPLSSTMSAGTLAPPVAPPRTPSPVVAPRSVSPASTSSESSPPCSPGAETELPSSPVSLPVSVAGDQSPPAVASAVPPDLEVPAAYRSSSPVLNPTSPSVEAADADLTRNSTPVAQPGSRRGLPRGLVKPRAAKRGFNRVAGGRSPARGMPLPMTRGRPPTPTRGQPLRVQGRGRGQPVTRGGMVMAHRPSVRGGPSLMGQARMKSPRKVVKPFPSDSSEDPPSPDRAGSVTS